MAKSKTTFNKREKEKDKLKKRQEKEEKKQDRKANARNGNNLDEMIAYLDENGNFTTTPPDQRFRREVKLEDIEIGVPKYEKEVEPDVHNGTVIMFNDAKGFGFIKDARTAREIFVHVNDCMSQIKQNDKVTFGLERTLKGNKAVQVTKI
jgi:cold shock CspA family protein